MLRVLPTTWIVVVIHGINNRGFVCDAYAFNTRVFLWELGQGFGIERSLCEKNAPFNDFTQEKTWPSGWELQGIQLTYQFLYTIPTERYITFQTDGFLCDGDSLDVHSRLVALAEYDFIGAPWCCGEMGGNGGFSMRSRSAMLNVVALLPERTQGIPAIFDHQYPLPFYNLTKFTRRNEDQISGYLINLKHGKIAPFHVAASFSVESILVTERALGFHKPWKNLPATSYDKFISVCPVVKLAEAYEKIDRPKSIFWSF